MPRQIPYSRKVDETLSTPAELFTERTAIRNDLLARETPARVPVWVTFTPEAACGFAGIEVRKAYYDIELVEKGLARVCADFYSDAMPVSMPRFPILYEMLGAKNWAIGSGGVLQHPELEPMAADEYDLFLAAPYEALLETFAPRIYDALNTTPAKQSVLMLTAQNLFKASVASAVAVFSRYEEDYGYATGFYNGSLCGAPFDFLADQLRSFKGIMMDIRRQPAKVAAACEALLPMIIKKALPVTPRPGVQNYIPTHLAPFLSEKAYRELYWPTFERMVVELDRQGVGCTTFCESDWTRFVDDLATLPKSSIFKIEAGDPQRWAEGVGKTHPFGGFWDPTITLAKSTGECIDSAKRLLEIGMKTGRFIFAFDKNVIDSKSVDAKKLAAVLEWVHENARY